MKNGGSFHSYGTVYQRERCSLSKYNKHTVSYHCSYGSYPQNPFQICNMYTGSGLSGVKASVNTKSLSEAWISYNSYSNSMSQPFGSVMILKRDFVSTRAAPARLLRLCPFSSCISISKRLKTSDCGTLGLDATPIYWTSSSSKSSKSALNWAGWVHNSQEIIIPISLKMTPTSQLWA